MRNKIEKNARQRKIIIRTRQYLHGSANLPTSMELQGFHYYREKIQRVAILFFSLSQKLHQKTLITKTTVYISCAQDSQWATKQAKKFSMA